MTPQHRDVVAAFEDAINMCWGNTPTRPHPKAKEFVDQPLSTYATYCGNLAYERMGGSNPKRSAQSVMGFGIGTSDFKTALGTGARRLAAVRYQNFSEHLQVCSEHEVNGFLPTDFPGADIALDLDKVGDGGEIKEVRPVAIAGQTAQLSTYAKRIDISRQIIVNDDIGLLGNFFSNIGTSAALTEAKLIATTLEANPTLADSQAMFGTANIVAQTLSATSLDAAMKALRQQPTASGNVANMAAYAIIVAAGLELTVKTILKLAGMDEIRVVTMPWLADGRWYLLADPSLAPVIGRLILPGTKEPITVGPVNTRTGFDGMALKVLVDTGIVMLGRIGIVRGGV